MVASNFSGLVSSPSEFRIDWITFHCDRLVEIFNTVASYDKSHFNLPHMILVFSHDPVTLKIVKLLVLASNSPLLYPRMFVPGVGFVLCLLCLVLIGVNQVVRMPRCRLAPMVTWFTIRCRITGLERKQNGQINQMLPKLLSMEYDSLPFHSTRHLRCQDVHNC